MQLIKTLTFPLDEDQQQKIILTQILELHELYFMSSFKNKSLESALYEAVKAQTQNLTKKGKLSRSDLKQFRARGWQTHFQVLVKASLTSLKDLDLSRCRLTSLQAIEWLDAPALKVIQVNDNLIVTLKPLAKCIFETREFSVYSKGTTQGNEYQHLSRTKLPKRVNISKLYRPGMKYSELGIIRAINNLGIAKMEPCENSNGFYEKMDADDIRVAEDPGFSLRVMEKFGLILHKV